MDEGDIAQLDVRDITARAERSRQAPLDALARLPDAAFAGAPGDEWSAAQALRHVVWVEHYWLALVRRMLESAESALILDEASNRELFLEACRLAGTPPEPLPAPPPYATKSDALRALEDSRRALNELAGSLTRYDFHRRFAGPRGTMSLRFAIEHIIEHDWDHAVQLAGLRSQSGT
jgi:uncharacterized damage-inducible protein DinB